MSKESDKIAVDHFLDKYLDILKIPRADNKKRTPGETGTTINANGRIYPNTAGVYIKNVDLSSILPGPQAPFNIPTSPIDDPGPRPSLPIAANEIKYWGHAKMDDATGLHNHIITFYKSSKKVFKLTAKKPDLFQVIPYGGTSARFPCKQKVITEEEGRLLWDALIKNGWTRGEEE